METSACMPTFIQLYILLGKTIEINTASKVIELVIQEISKKKIPLQKLVKGRK